MAKKKKETKKEEKAKEVKQELTIEEKFAELNDKHLRLFAEFENFKSPVVWLIIKPFEPSCKNLNPLVEPFK